MGRRGFPVLSWFFCLWGGSLPHYMPWWYPVGVLDASVGYTYLHALFSHFQLKFWIPYESLTMGPWCSNYSYCATLFRKIWTQVLHRFKSCSWWVGDLRCWEFLTCSRLEIKLNAFPSSTIPLKQFIVIFIFLSEEVMKYLMVFINYQSRVSLVQNYEVVSWLAQSNEYQEILET